MRADRYISRRGMESGVPAPAPAPAGAERSEASGQAPASSALPRLLPWRCVPGVLGGESTCIGGAVRPGEPGAPLPPLRAACCAASTRCVTPACRMRESAGTCVSPYPRHPAYPTLDHTRSFSRPHSILRGPLYPTRSASVSHSIHAVAEKTNPQDGERRSPPPSPQPQCRRAWTEEAGVR